MANRNILLCLLILCASIYLTECKFGRSGGGRGGSSWGKSWGGGSSHSSHSSHSSGSSWFSSSKPSSSSSGSSGSSWWSSSKPSSGGSHGYPSSSSGLSGSGSRSHGYPSSSSGLSGSGSGSHGYPSSSSGLSGSGRGSHGYPSSSSGLSGSGSGSGYPWSSGSGSRPSYPSSSTGLSGSAAVSGNNYPSSGSGTHRYPSGPGLSGTGSGGNTWSTNNNYGSHGGSYKPTNTYNTNSGYGPGYHSGSYYNGYQHGTTHYYPQHVYVTEYRDSGSRYGDLLTGLTWYNLGRSHNGYYHDHYYYDDYYRRRYDSPSSNGYRSGDRPSDTATCTLRIKENGRVELLKIPCEIVSTFTEGSKKVDNISETRINTTVCTTNTTVIKRTMPTNIAVNTSENSNITDSSMTTAIPSIDNVTQNAAVNVTAGNNTVANVTASITNPSPAVPSKPITIEKNVTIGNTTTHTVRIINSTEEIVNITVCTTTSSFNGTDPLSIKGQPIDPSQMDCSVDIKTKDAYFRHDVDCSVLMKYSKLNAPPEKKSAILPEREKLKSWLNKPPWWMSMFIAV